MRAFDLMPKESEREKSSASPAFLKVVLALVAILVLAGLAGAFMMMDARAKERQAVADDLRAQLAEIEAQATEDAGPNTATLTAEGQARTAALSEALAARVAWDRILREFSLVLPEDVWLTTLASSTPDRDRRAQPGGPGRRDLDVHDQRLRLEPGGGRDPALAPRGHPRVRQRPAAVELARHGRGRGRLDLERRPAGLQLLDRGHDRAPGGAGPVKRQIPVAVIVLPALLILALVGYFLLIKPKQDAAGSLAGEIATLETQVEVAMAAQRQPPTDESTIQVAEVFQVTKAMPDEDDMPGIILELNSVASASGIEFLSIAPQAAAVQASYTALPINLSFEGNYYDLTDFLFRLRNLVSVRDGELEADGRLYALETLSMTEGPDGFPEIAASLTITAYYYSTAPPPAAPVAPAAPGSTDTPPRPPRPRPRAIPRCRPPSHGIREETPKRPSRPRRRSRRRC